LRWDILADLNYEETVLATTSGAYSDYSISNQNDAALFVDALWGSGTDCTFATNELPTCGITTTNLTPLLGDNTNQYYDFAWFLSDDGEYVDTGYIEFMMIDPNPGQFKMLGEYRTIEWTDKQSSSGEDPENPVTWLLYRDISSVPAPPGLIGVKWHRKEA
jgi:hypothetical protein